MTEKRSRKNKLLDAFTHSGPGYDPTPRREPGDPAAWALAQHIAGHHVSTVQNAFRYLGWNIRITAEPLQCNCRTGECEPETGAFAHKDGCQEAQK